MKSLPISHAGRRMLNRRSFLQFAGTGLGGIALTTLLAEQGLLASDKSPIRPQIDSANPLAPR
ncbi:MAG: twin-arginine translocation signal domain-containing protein, partial [Verrucomicrobiota bacterium]